MKKIIASASLAAVGATGLHAAYAPGLTRMETSKPWSISASLRGFYDDNYTAAPSALADDSYGIEVRPSFALNFPMERTYVGLAYTYSLKYYADRPGNSTDHQHEFLAKVDHRFTERYSLQFEDSMVYSQEPEVVDSSGAITTFRRTNADAFRNRARINFRAELTELLGLEAGYQNTWYDYHEDGPGSRSALLDRVEHLLHLDARYQVQEHLIGLVGYQYGIVDYTSDDSIFSPALPGFPGDIRDNHSHYFYVGADHSFSSKLSGSVRVGAQYTEYDDLDHDTWSPYFDLSGTYTYLPGSYVRFGFRHARNATDIVGVAPDVVGDQESSTLYAMVNHRITRRITGNVLGQFQHSTFEGGSFDGEADNFYLLGLNVEYKISEHWLAETGYNWDRLDSDLSNRSFTRNRVYIGVRATY